MNDRLDDDITIDAGTTCTDLIVPNRAPILRPYQHQIIDDFKRACENAQRILLVCPTGGGKTVIFADIIRDYVAGLKPVVVVAHRREIISQTSQKLRDLNIPHGIVMAGTKPRPFENVQVAAIQTLHRRTFASDAMTLPPASLLIFDEAHHCPAKTYKQVIDAYPDAVILGVTATPCRGDGRGLGGIFKVLIETPQVAALITDGYLVRTRVYAPVDPDLRGVRVVNGDYAEDSLAERMDRPELIGDIVTHFHKFGERRKTIAFGVNVAHSVHLRDEFLKSGVRAEHVDGSTPKPERDAVLARLAFGETELVVNCMVLTEGFDLPAIGCCILARPTRKMGLYRQMIGRVLRPAEGKPDAIVLDHSGAVFRHGFVEDDVLWTLDPDKRAKSPTHTKRCEDPQLTLIECSRCSVLRTPGGPCPNCGFMPQRKPKAVDVADGDLGLIDPRTRTINGVVYDRAAQLQWHAMLTHIAEERGYQRGWIAHKYNEKFGDWPPRGVTPLPQPPSPEVKSWVRSRMIAWAKARGAA